MRAIYNPAEFYFFRIFLQAKPNLLSLITGIFVNRLIILHFPFSDYFLSRNTAQKLHVGQVVNPHVLNGASLRSLKTLL